VLGGRGGAEIAGQESEIYLGRSADIPRQLPHISFDVSLFLHDQLHFDTHSVYW
jgi:hypothetical protein